MPNKEYEVNGTVYEFPDNFSDAQVQSLLTEHGIIKGKDKPAIPPDAGIRPQTNSDIFRESVGRPLTSVLPALGSILGGMVPGAEAVSAPLGTLTGSAAAYGIRKQFPSLFGAPEPSPFTNEQQSPQEYMANDLLFQEAVPQLAGNIVSRMPTSMPSLFAKLKSISPAVKEVREADRVATNAAAVREFQQNPELNTLPESNLNPKAADFTLRYNTQIRNHQAAMDSLINTGFSPTTGRVDPVKILDNLAKSPAYYSAIEPMARENLKKLLTDINSQESFVPKENGSPFFRYIKHRFAFDAATMGLGEIAGGHVGGVAALGTVYLADSAVRQALKNPETVKLMLEAIKTPAGSPKAKLLGQALRYSLKGADVILRKQGDQDVSGRIDDQGRIVEAAK